MRIVVVVGLAVVAACDGGTAAGGDGAVGADAAVPTPAGCVTDVTPGDHVYSCGGLQVDVRIPPACEAPGCGLILELHGDTGTGLLMDAHVQLRELGAQHGFITVAPTGPPYGSGLPGSTWHASNDATLIELVGEVAQVFRVDPHKVHVTGFSRGGFVTWRLLCDHADLFASAAPAGAGNGTSFAEQTCFDQGRAPSRALPILFLMGRTDVSVGYGAMTTIRDGAIASYAATGPIHVTTETSYVHDRWTGPNGELIETFDHAYETVSDGPWASARGHCIPGSTMDPYAPQYAIPCKQPNGFVWGEQVMAFFLAHPMP
jgi:polyhydroxybutyrate depolymerase